MEIITGLAIESWDEKPYLELPTGEKLNRAAVSTVGTEGFTGTATFDSLLYYRADGTSSYVGLQRFAGRLGDRDGSFVVQVTGTYDGTTARLAGSVVDGSGTGELAGITGELSSASTHADYPTMPITLRYELG